MKRPLLIALMTVAACTVIAESADARSGYERRQDRRQAIVAGAIREDIATYRAEERYRECMRESGYDQSCDRQLWEDEQDARRKARRTAVVVGSLN
jgi:hypothetical protein